MTEKDPLIEINLRAMEFIWSKVPKEIKDGGEYVTYVKGDLPYLYYSGMVDAQRYTLEQWQKAFEDCLGEDGRYWVSHEKMLWLGRFRYSKTVNEPFDPLKIRTGKYTADRLWKLFENSVIPSTSLPKEFLKNIFDQYYRQGKSVGQMIGQEALKKIKEIKLDMEPIDETKHVVVSLMDSKEYVMVERDLLENLKKLLDMYPSPRRRLELAVYQMRMDKLQKLADIATKPQQSSFEAGPDFRETTKKDLKSMLVKASENVTGGRKPTGEVLDLKALQKKKKPPTKF